MKAVTKILLVEDNPDAREAWATLISSWGYQIDSAEDGERALQLIESYDPQILLLDLRLPKKDGLTVLCEIRAKGWQLPTIVISGEGEIADAVQSIKLGAYDYLRKPIDPHHLEVLLNNLRTHLSISKENQLLRRRLIEAGKLGPMVGQSLAMRRVMALVEQVAPSTASVIIVGESGTGKELVARIIHDLSPRARGPYIAINCAALPETLMESELFGHERGAFTGADRRREGCFELATGGTLLLDEIGEMKPELQAKLLRVLEERKIRRLGGGTEIPVDVRVLAATNRKLEMQLREGKFREDLYYRLNVFSIQLPTLRERVEDLPALIEHFLRQLPLPAGKSVVGMETECLDLLKGQTWPGNVRQLRNVIERALVVTSGPMISAVDLPEEIKPHAPREAASRTPSEVKAGNGGSSALDVRVGMSLTAVKRELLLQTVKFTRGNKAKAAEILGVSLKTIYNHLKED
ncbi:MAG TPA: sigma-54 dependent transcriptional regulator [Candidatus Acidoferrales bacterium]|nr:sigma-54 dependent transcriptional regulator [Candidatus Acidoferrales bacterium]